MDVSKLSISQETIAKLNAMAYITPQRKQQIRLNGIKELIYSKPAGHVFTIKDLMRAAGYRCGDDSKNRQYYAGSAFVKYYINKGVIVKENGIDGPFESPYHIDESKLTAYKKKNVSHKGITVSDYIDMKVKKEETVNETKAIEIVEPVIKKNYIVSVKITEVIDKDNTSEVASLTLTNISLNIARDITLSVIESNM